MDLDAMIADFLAFKTFAIRHPNYASLVGRYFPIFWDGNTAYLALDLDPPNLSRVVLIDPESAKSVSPAYDSLERFLEDAISSNNKRERLKCFT